MESTMMYIFQIILGLIIIISFFCVIGEEKNENLRSILGYINVSAILALICSFVF